MGKPYQQIITESSSPTSPIILKIFIQKMTDKDPPPLTDAQLGDFLFIELKIPINDVIQLDFSNRSDSKQIKVKQTTILTHIVTDHKDFPHFHKDHEITISTLSLQSTKVTFIDVPLTVPDEELRHLCALHGTLVDGIVHRVYVKLGGVSKVSIPGPTRWLNVHIVSFKKVLRISSSLH